MKVAATGITLHYESDLIKELGTGTYGKLVNFLPGGGFLYYTGLPYGFLLLPPSIFYPSSKRHDGKDDKSGFGSLTSHNFHRSYLFHALYKPQTSTIFSPYRTAIDHRKALLKEVRDNTLFMIEVELAKSRKKAEKEGIIEIEGTRQTSPGCIVSTKLLIESEILPFYISSMPLLVERGRNSQIESTVKWAAEVHNRKQEFLAELGYEGRGYGFDTRIRRAKVSEKLKNELEQKMEERILNVAPPPYIYDNIIDLIISEPDVTAEELSKVFGYSEKWVRTLTVSHSFQGRLNYRRDLFLGDRKKELSEAIEERLTTLSLSTLDKLAETLETTSEETSLSILKLVSEVEKVKALVSSDLDTYKEVDYLSLQLPLPPSQSRYKKEGKKGE